MACLYGLCLEIQRDIGGNVGVYTRAFGVEPGWVFRKV